MTVSSNTPNEPDDYQMKGAATTAMKIMRSCTLIPKAIRPIILIHRTRLTTNGRANEVAEAWADNPNCWQAISLSDAQQYANDGYFVVAGYINPNPRRSGHVVVVVPGTEIVSKKWGIALPCIMDTGGSKRAVGISLGEGFGLDKKSDIKFYYYKKQ